MHDSLAPMLAAIGWECVYQPKITRAEIIDIIPDYDGLIIRSKTRVDRELVGHANKLKFVGRAGAGIDNLDEAVLKILNIRVLNAPEGNRNAVAEHTVGLALALLNNLTIANEQVRQGVWDREGNRGMELASQTVGLLGYGFMGTAVAKKLTALGCKVLVYDKYKRTTDNGLVSSVEMDQIFEEADIFSIHVPLTPETRNMIDLNYLNQFKKSVVIINTARGEVLQLEGLLEAMKLGKVRSAGLDVLENEKLNNLTENQQMTFSKLIKSSKIILTPHVAGWSLESYKRINEVLAEKIDAEINVNN
ncbi:phosphoglycerate dehydrogenase [Fulvivirga sp. M361]|nr:phosphoglycerate dehydrogenase [Fulvivirga sp. M361]